MNKLHRLTWFLLICRVSDPEMPGYGDPPTAVWRRYSEFELLKNYLDITYSAIVVPAMPEKRVSGTMRKVGINNVSSGLFGIMS